MSKRKYRERDAEESAAGKGDDDAPKPEIIIANPPQPNALFLGTTAVAYFLWLAFLLWMSLAR